MKNQELWLHACAQRLTELDSAVSIATAHRIAMRLWNYRKPVCYRHAQPAAAAEAWHGAGETAPGALRDEDPVAGERLVNA